jgi:hypothetical protein
MDEPIGEIDGRTCGLPRVAESVPFGAAEYLEDQHGCVMPVGPVAVNGPVSRASHLVCAFWHREGFDTGDREQHSRLMSKQGDPQ